MASHTGLSQATSQLLDDTNEVDMIVLDDTAEPVETVAPTEPVETVARTVVVNGPGSVTHIRAALAEYRRNDHPNRPFSSAKAHHFMAEYDMFHDLTATQQADMKREVFVYRNEVESKFQQELNKAAENLTTLPQAIASIGKLSTSTKHLFDRVAALEAHRQMDRQDPLNLGRSDIIAPTDPMNTLAEYYGYHGPPANTVIRGHGNQNFVNRGGRGRGVSRMHQAYTSGQHSQPRHPYNDRPTRQNSGRSETTQRAHHSPVEVKLSGQHLQPHHPHNERPTRQNSGRSENIRRGQQSPPRHQPYARPLHTNNGRNEVFRRGNQSTHHQHVVRDESQTCHLCITTGRHYSGDCDQFTTLDERKERLKDLGRCVRCLGEGHEADSCGRNAPKCSNCKLRGHKAVVCPNSFAAENNDTNNNCDEENGPEL